MNFSTSNKIKKINGYSFQKTIYLSIILLLTLKPHEAASEMWTWHQSCWNRNACSVASSITEYCQMVADDVVTPIGSPPFKVNEMYGPVIGIGFYSIAREDIPDSSTTAICSMYHGQFTFAARTIPGSGCRDGARFDSLTMACVEKADNNKCTAGNPVTIAEGRKIQVEIDSVQEISGNKNITIKRYYASHNNALWNSYITSLYDELWRFEFTDRLAAFNFTYSSTGARSTVVRITNPAGADIYFLSYDDISWENRNGGQERLVKFNNFGVTSWKLYLSDSSVKTFDIEGKLIQVETAQRDFITFVYSDRFLNSVLGLKFVNIKWNDVTVFSYIYLGDKITQITNPQNFTYEYSYDTSGNLVNVEYPDGAIKQYHYENLVFKNSLTGITDERGIRYASWAYDSQGRAISSEHAGGAEKTLLTFNSDGSTTVTNPLNKQTNYRFADIAGARRVVKVEGQPTTNCVGANQDYTYTPEGWVASKTDWKGIKTTFTYNLSGKELTRTDAFGTSQARITKTEWHPTLNLKTKVTEFDKETVYTYDGTGLLTNQNTRSLMAP